MGSSASCRNSQVSSTSKGNEMVKKTYDRKVIKKPSNRIPSQASSIVKKNPTDQPSLTEKPDCSGCEETSKPEENKPEHYQRSVINSKVSKQSLFPYQSTTKSISNVPPKTPSHYDAVSSWKTSSPNESVSEVHDGTETGNEKGEESRGCSSEVQVSDIQRDGCETSIEESRKPDSEIEPPQILVQHEIEESQLSSSSSSNCLSQPDDGDSSSGSSSTDSEVAVNVRSPTINLIHENHIVRGSQIHENNETSIGAVARGSDDGNNEEEFMKCEDGIVTILSSLEKCNLEMDSLINEAEFKVDHCSCGHVCSDDRYRDTLMDMIREETPDRADLVTSIFRDEEYYELMKGRRSFDDDVSLEVNIRSPSLHCNVCRFCHTEDINEEDEDGSTRQYRVIEELELNKYELSDCGDDVDVEDNSEKLGSLRDDEEEEEEGNFSSDISAAVIIEEDSDLALSASTDQEIDFLERNVSFDRDELSTILLRDKRKKFADLRSQNSSNGTKKDSSLIKVRNGKKSNEKRSKELCSKKRRRKRRRSVCGKLECSFCDLVNLTGREGDIDEANHEWNQLDSDTVKLMDILDKLSRVLAEKAKDLVNRRSMHLKHRDHEDEDDDRTVEIRKKDQLQGLRELGVSVKKVENRRRLLILKDDVSQYRIQGG